VKDAVMLDDVDWVRFSGAVEASFQVANRQQFFVWTQGSVQGLVPHQILLCGIREPSGAGLRMQHFTASRYFKQEHFEILADPSSGLIKPLVEVCGERGGPIVFSPSLQALSTGAALDELVLDNELQNLAAMLIHGVDGQVDAFYGFSRVPAAFDARLRHLIALMVPHLHSTLVRVLSKERETDQPGEARDERLITPRQAEILMLIKDGKTNAEIAAMLDCSQWTVKNHIQNILRRLKTSSRTHALVVAMRMGLLRPD
jgi:transcriptional regulator EpsA